MNENLIKTDQDFEGKTKLKNFYEKNKVKIILTLLTLIILIVSFTTYLEVKKNKRISLSERYIEAKVYLEDKDTNKAENILKNIIFENDSTYSSLSLFLILNENLIEDKNEVIKLFNHILENCKFDKEIENLIIYKKALFETSFVDESKLLVSLNPLLNSDSLWKPHALMLLGDYYFSKKQNIKAKEFYLEVMKLKNLNQELYNKTRNQLVSVGNNN